MGHLKQLHEILKSMEYTLTHGNITTIDFGNSVSAAMYAANDSASYFFGNANSTTDHTITFQGNNYIPAWSAEDEPESHGWLWRPESIDDTRLHGRGEVTANKLHGIRVG
ncbi:unnamed protein product [Prunus armeniaca]|uniref:Uncharacterized protein n=1 Tax=Prunus armeniaca TaxID=36596 RepID=A0A6J5XK96_PRUAR|nr:unnamed protein product [Prunus armeniaca]